MAQAFAGVWKIQKIEGAEEYFNAIGHAEMAKDIANITEIEVQVDGKTVTTISKFEGKDNKVDIVVLDETTEKEGPDGVKIVSKAYMDGATFRQEGSAGNDNWKVIRYIQDGASISEIIAKGTTLKITMVKA
ncbi:hypothetical protein BgiMline_026473 [Biomphalaria glabrata]|uniref:Uncharacterized protein LOC106054823 n=1 Tax=Biomphalaria glabrata TaxID=6526 RepID=A0A2C9LUW7_BIOGL|nr:uncharacterized protein LOC106054823 [Biomphalaria glabrata]XP_055860931.1 uncharacterized protein LOC106054823 [Biomphalaria glabrata]KAI8743956.1 hypothetical protein BgiMline_020953 [Biomphalaria glabrata]